MTRPLAKDEDKINGAFLAQAKVASVTHGYMASGRETEPRITAYLRHRVSAELEKPGMTLEKLSARSGLTSSQLSTIRSGKRGVGFKSLTGLADAFGMTLDQVRSEADEFAKRNPLPPQTERVVYDERYPNFGIAADAARADLLHDGYTKEEIERAIEYARVGMKSDRDLLVRQWLADIERAARDLRERAKDPLAAEVERVRASQPFRDRLEELKKEPTFAERLAEEKRKAEIEPKPEPLPRRSGLTAPAKKAK
jgi:transcriptional regulator with XRE-family HTH domain